MPDNAMWRDRHRLLDEGHSADLESRAAIHEMAGGLDRRSAEDHAYAEYLKEHMGRAAGHHLAGMRVAHAAGDKIAGMQHGVVYGLLMRAMGHNPHGEPPPEISAMAKDPILSPVYQFKPHGSDALVLDILRQQQGGKKLAKGEFVSMQGNLLEKTGSTTVYDMSHLLGEERRTQGEALHVHEGENSTSVHHLRLEEGRRLPLHSFIQDKDQVDCIDGAAPGDVAAAAQRAVKLREAAKLAEVVVSGRRAAQALDTARSIIE